MSDKRIKVLLKNLVSEDGAKELATSLDMEPYLRLAIAELQQMDTAPKLKEIVELPLERRYVWRIASALKWGFADFDSVNVIVDRETLSPEDLVKVTELRLRPIQFCIFLKALVGTEAMEQLMLQAIATSKQEGC